MLQDIVEDGIKPPSMSREEYERLQEVAEAMRDPETGIPRQENKLGYALLTKARLEHWCRSTL